MPERITAQELTRRTQLALEHEARYRFVLPLLGGRRLLDVGCGEGLLLELAGMAGALERFGIDTSADAVTRAKERLGDAPDLHLVHGRAETLPFADRSFDVVTVLETLEHLEQPDAAVAESRRVVRLDGVVIASVPNDELLAAANPYHRNRFTHGRFLGLMRQHFPHVRLFRLVTYAGATVLPFGHDEISLRLPELEHRGWAAIASMRKLGSTTAVTALSPLSALEAESTGRFERVISHLNREIEGLKTDLRDMRQSALYHLIHRVARQVDRLSLKVPDWVIPRGFRDGEPVKGPDHKGQ